MAKCTTVNQRNIFWRDFFLQGKGKASISFSKRG